MIKVLDHGFVKLHNLAGPSPIILPGNEFSATDRDPANVARMSFNQMDSGRTEDQDLKLASYLIKNKHWTPFESIEIWVEMKLPIFVARQFVRHRTVTLNEVSGRYVTLPAEWYIPEVVGGKPTNAKQGQTDNLDAETQAWFKRKLNDQCNESYQLYLESIERGVAAEHARTLLHLNHYTHWMWKQDLRNMLGFLSLRDHSHAQIESQKYAKAVDGLLRKHLPHTMELYDSYCRLP